MLARNAGTGPGTALLRTLLPGPVACRELYEHPVRLDLFPEEDELVAQAVEKRRREFAGVRSCARAALAEFGHPPVPILNGERGAPSWPDGFVGSMTHCTGYAAAAVARGARMASIGIDAEPHEPLPDGVLNAITLPEETQWVEALRGDRPAVHWDRLLFSVKESVYKCWFPLMGRWLDFTQALVRVTVGARSRPDHVAALRAGTGGDGDPQEIARGRFAAGLLTAGPTVRGKTLDGFEGSWVVARGLVVTAIALPC